MAARARPTWELVAMGDGLVGVVGVVVVVDLCGGLGRGEIRTRTRARRRGNVKKKRGQDSGRA